MLRFRPVADSNASRHRAGLVGSGKPGPHLRPRRWTSAGPPAERPACSPAPARFRKTCSDQRVRTCTVRCRSPNLSLGPPPRPAGAIPSFLRAGGGCGEAFSSIPSVLGRLGGSEAGCTVVSDPAINTGCPARPAVFSHASAPFPNPSPTLIRHIGCGLGGPGTSGQLAAPSPMLCSVGDVRAERCAHQTHLNDDQRTLRPV